MCMVGQATARVLLAVFTRKVGSLGILRVLPLRVRHVGVGL